MVLFKSLKKKLLREIHCQCDSKPRFVCDSPFVNPELINPPYPEKLGILFVIFCPPK